MEGDGLREGLADLLGDLPPGAALVAALAEVELAALSASELALVVVARARQVNHDQGWLMAASLELGLTPFLSATGPTTRFEELDKNSAEMVGPAVHWSRRTCVPYLHLADDVVRRLPVVHQAMLSGSIDLEKAGVFSRYLGHLGDDTARTIAARFVGPAANWTVEHLATKLRQAAIAADPEAAKQRQARSVVYRNIYFGLDADGTASIEASHLPALAVVEAKSNIDRLARAAKAAGDNRLMPQLRADITLDLMRGIPFRWAPTLDPVTHQADTAHRDDNPYLDQADAHTEARAHQAWARALTQAWAQASPPASAHAHAGSGPGNERPRDTDWDWPRGDDVHPPGGQMDPALIDPALIDHEVGEPTDWWRDTWPGPSGGQAFPDHLFPDHLFPDQLFGDPAPPTLLPLGGAPPGGSPPGGSSAGTAPPGAAPTGRDPVSGPLGGGVPAGESVASHPRGSEVCPTCQTIVTPAPRRGVCNIMVDLGTLMLLNEHPGLIPGWGPVIADIARQAALNTDNPMRWLFGIVDARGRLLHQVETRRRPDTIERNFIKTRDQTCRFPGCHRASYDCDDDHRTDYAHGGISLRTNCAALCRLHHRLKHHWGVTYEIGIGGMVYWRYPDGRTYVVPPDGLPWYTGDDLDNAPRRQPTDQIIPRTRIAADDQPIRLNA